MFFISDYLYRYIWYLPQPLKDKRRKDSHVMTSKFYFNCNLILHLLIDNWRFAKLFSFQQFQWIEISCKGIFDDVVIDAVTKVCLWGCCRYQETIKVVDIYVFTAYNLICIALFYIYISVVFFFKLQFLVW